MPSSNSNEIAGGDSKFESPPVHIDDRAKVRGSKCPGRSSSGPPFPALGHQLQLIRRSLHRSHRNLGAIVPRRGNARLLVRPERRSTVIANKKYPRIQERSDSWNLFPATPAPLTPATLLFDLFIIQCDGIFIAFFPGLVDVPAFPAGFTAQSEEVQ